MWSVGGGAGGFHWLGTLTAVFILAAFFSRALALLVSMPLLRLSPKGAATEAVKAVPAMSHVLSLNPAPCGEASTAAVNAGPVVLP